ncbi:MAG: MaoC family dehydratase N-terminal domain-containing protein [Ectothiorhodospiraceae bacterium]|nr:MaoC family dehydratase N-terminal domain-containing protein [Ectothiorhodospiraceae bacterium]
MELKYWEDFQIGETFRFGEKLVSREEMLDYARRFDPHPLHLDRDAAIAAGLRDIRASTFQVCCFCMRMMVDDRLKGSTSQGSPGVQELRWLLPVYPGDRLEVRQEVLSKRRHPRRPEVGFCNSGFELRNQDAEVVMRMFSAGIFKLRDPGAPMEEQA